MGTFIWLCISTAIGLVVGGHWFDAATTGGIIGFIVGLIIRYGTGDNNGSGFFDTIDSFGGSCGDDSGSCGD